MRSCFLVRRRLLVAAILGAAQFFLPRAARADLWGADIPLLTSILSQAVNMASSLVEMITVMQQQLAAMRTMLSQASGASLASLLEFLRSSELTFAEMTRGITSIGYTLQSVNGQFRAVYRSDYAGMPSDAFDSMRGRWQDEILASAQVAARSQAALSTLQRSTDETEKILRNSSTEEGVVAQLQAVVRILGVIQGQNNTLIHSLVTSGRVLASTAASQASEQQLSREKKRRHLAGYRDRGLPVPPMSRLP